LARVLPHNGRLRAALRMARLAKPLAGLFEAFGLDRIAALLRRAPAQLPRRSRIGGRRRRRVIPPQGAGKGRVALLAGCVSPVLMPSINEAAIAVLTRHGIEIG